MNKGGKVYENCTTATAAMRPFMVWTWGIAAPMTNAEMEISSVRKYDGWYEPIDQ